MSESIRGSILGILAVAGLAAAASASRAAIADPTRDGTVTVSGTTAAERPELLGMVLSDSTQPFEIRNETGTLLSSGTLRQQIVRETDRGTLDFYYQVSNSAGAHSFFSLEVFGFQPGKLEVDYISDPAAGVVGPSRVSALSEGTIASFNFEPGGFLSPGETTALMFVRTRSREFISDDAGKAIVFAARLSGDSDFENLISSAMPVARPVPLPIPLPPGAYAGLTVLVPMGAGLIWRRRAGGNKLEVSQ